LMRCHSAGNRRTNGKERRSAAMTWHHLNQFTLQFKVLAAGHLLHSASAGSQDAHERFRLGVQVVCKCGCAGRSERGACPASGETDSHSGPQQLVSAVPVRLKGTNTGVFPAVGRVQVCQQLLEVAIPFAAGAGEGLHCMRWRPAHYAPCLDSLAVCNHANAATIHACLE